MVKGQVFATEREYDVRNLFYVESNKIPKFKNEDEEREFWATHDTTNYLDSFEPVELHLPNLKQTTKK